MKKTTFACALLLGASVSMSQGDIGLFGSYWSQDDGDDVLGGGAGVYLNVVPLEFRATYYERTSAPDAGSFRAIPIDFGLALRLTRATPVRVAAMGGGSYYILDPSTGSLDNKFGWYVGGRLEMPVHAGAAIFGELLYRGADFSNVDGDFSGFAVNLGLMF